MHQGVPMSLAKVCPHLLIELIVVEQSIQRSQHRIDLRCQLGHLGEHIFSRVAVN